MDQQILATLRAELHSFAGSLVMHICLLRRHSNNENIGTGYLVTLNTIISPTPNFEVLKNGKDKIYFYPKMKLSYGIREIDAYKPYDGPLSVARVSSSTPVFLPSD